jgi:glycosyltransferase involved in cell wall biosynthesis
VACPSAGDLPEWAEAAGARWVPLELRRSPHRSDALGAIRLRKLAASSDVVHLHSSKAGAVGRLAVVSLGRSRPACVFTPHGWSWLVGGPLAPVYRCFERGASHLADAIVAVSPEEAELGRPVLGSGAKRMHVINNGVDVDRFRPDGPRARRSTDPLLVLVGHLYPPKGQDLALWALSRMRHRRARLRLVGDGPDRAKLEETTLVLGLEDRVEWAGKVEDPAPHLRAADLVLVPSRYDGLSLALLEAMACGAAVVASAVPGTCALEGSGALVPANDTVALADAADDLLDEPGQRAKLGHLARERVVEEYRLSRSLALNIELWDKLVS